MEKQLIIRITEKDNVAVALQPLQAGQEVSLNGQSIILKNDIPFGHKIALQDFQLGDHIIKYGQPIGHAKAPIALGEHIHTHNLKTNLDGLLEYSYQPQENPAAQAAKHADASFMGYVRTDGQVGVRNEIWIIPTVGCVNTTANLLAKAAAEKFKGKVDGVYAYTHNMGCSQLGTDHRRTQEILKGLIRHPNAGGVLVLSLGCENNNLDNFKPVLGDIDPQRVKFLVTQDVTDEYEAGMKLLEELTDYASSFKRQSVPASKLVLGFKCGGSDAFSGITANPLCGRINDLLVSLGGTTILTEVPEMFGAETLLMKRAVSKEVFDKTVHLINDFKSYFTRYGQTIYENPSPGNKKGGISSLEEKSLGCTQKGGHAPVVDVLNYGQQAVKNGLNLLIGPGNDQVSCTNLVASGAQLVLFTTGRGNPFGSPVPTVKIATNTGLATRKPHWIDFNAGQILEGISFEQATEKLFEQLLNIASGREQTNNEKFGYKEISVFRDGVIL